jgi:hypothetical protein
MAKFFYFILLLQVAANGYTQTNSWSFELKLHSGIVFPIFQNDQNPTFEAQVRDSYLPRFAPGGTLTVGYQVAPRVILQAGLGYWFSGARLREQDLIIVTPDLPEGLYKGTFEGKLHYHDLLAPLYIKGYPIVSNPRFYLIGGFSGMLNLARKQSIVFHYLDGTRQTIQEDMPEQDRTFNNLNLRSDLGFGYAFPLGKKMLGFLEPLFGYQVFPVIKGGASKWGQYCLGINLGITMGR